MTLFRLGLPLAVLVLAAGLAGQQAPADPADGVVSGTVHDGVTHQPIAGVIVNLELWGGPSDATSAARVTDEKGRFVFEGVKPFFFDGGRREHRGLTARKLGYLEASYGRDAPVLGNPGLSFAPILIAPGEWLEDVDLTLWPAASVSGTVTDEYGEPFVDQLVRVLTADPVGGYRPWSTVETVVTDDRGRYFAGRLAPGRYVIAAPAAVAPEGSVQVRPGRYYPSALRLADARPVVVAAGARLTGIDIARLPAPASRLSGRVTGPASGTWPPLLLALTVEGDPYIGPVGFVATALLEPNGTFVFPRVPPGAYVIRTSPSVGTDSFPIQRLTSGPNQLPLSLAAPRGQLSDAGFRAWSLAASPDAVSAPYFAHTSVAVGETSVTNVVVALEHAVTLSGVVTSDVPPVVGRFGPMMPRVFAEPADSDAGVPSKDASVDPSGAFVVDGLAPGAYFLRTAESRGSIRSVLVADREMSDQPIDVSQSISGVAISATGASSVYGDVRAGNTRASVRAAVIYFPSDRQLWTQASSKSARFGSAFVNTDGTYDSFALLPGGEYYVVAIPWFDGWRSEAFLEAAARVATTVHVTWAGRVRQDLQVQEVKLP